MPHPPPAFLRASFFSIIFPPTQGSAPPRRLMAHLTESQTAALQAFGRGSNVQVIAVPGAGKSRVLVEACARRCRDDGRCIVVSYNTQLNDATKAQLAARGLTDRAAAYTFHGLCTACIRFAPDDDSLLDAIDAAEAGELEVRPLAGVSALLVDEAQDFKHSFARLLRLCISASPQRVHMIVGDPRQCLYDYNSDDPAVSAYLEHPSEHYASDRPWESFELNETHRVPGRVVDFVNCVFGTSIRAVKAAGFPVEVLSTDTFNDSSIIEEKLRAVGPEHSVAILISRKRNNWKLHRVVNHLGGKGLAIHVHGIDGQDARTKDGKLPVLTWHAAKGTEYDVTFVVGVDSSSSMNPLYVALTRAKERLILLQDKADPHPDIVRACASMCDSVATDAATKRMASRLLEGVPLPCRAPHPPEASPVVSLVDWSPHGATRWARQLMRATRLGPTSLAETAEGDSLFEGVVVQTEQGRFEDVTRAYLTAARMRLEYEATGRVGFVEEMHRPQRTERGDRAQHVREGGSTRFVAMHIQQTSMLARRDWSLISPYPSSAEGWLDCAAASLTWCGFHHCTRQKGDVRAWADSALLDAAIRAARTALAYHAPGEDAVFDRTQHVVKGEVTFCVQPHASTEKGNWHFVYAPLIAASDRIAALAQAAFHPQRRCFLLNARTAELEAIDLLDGDAFFDQLLARRAAS